MDNLEVDIVILWWLLIYTGSLQTWRRSQALPIVNELALGFMMIAIVTNT